MGMTGRRIRVRGQVQGVGFRPFVWQLARRFGIVGRVLNDAEGVLIFAAGEAVAAFTEAISAERPKLAVVDAIEWDACDVGGDGFVIAESGGAGAETRVTPDAATCVDCLAEVFDPADRRFRYPFANCTHCGPRFTIVRGLPYDRAKTTMADFPMCDACRAEYGDPGDRRFHAQPVACAVCGPRVWMEPAAEDWLGDAVARLRRGEVLAIKGLGGFHLACDASNAEAVALLRARKRRVSKPFALMAELDVLRRFAEVGAAEEALLSDPAAPVVLLAKGAEALPDGVAPGMACFGWMLPYTPLHHLLLRDFGGVLVMTSGNLSGEPQVIGNDEAREKLAGFADAFVMHDREIARRLDDSVERAVPRMVLRRARGRVPGTFPLPPGFERAPQVVACGGQMKGAICLLKNGQALLGHHLGELDEALSWDAFLAADRDYAALFDHHPEVVAVDLHDGYRATQHGRGRAEQEGLRCEIVQHHHAHLASCLGENGWPLDGGRVAGIVLDGTGLGDDGTIWGGELLLGDYRGFERRAWLRPAPLVGGDMAAREPWRNALMRLDQAGLSDWADKLFPDRPLAMLRMAAARGVNAPLSSSAGRLFDAVSACLGVCAVQSYEGEAAMRLEAMAEATGHPGYVFADVGPEIDPAPVFRAMGEDIRVGKSAGYVSDLFHAGLARAFARRARALVEAGEARAVALSGGCFQNARLLAHALDALEGVPVLVHAEVPSGDGGLALGQALVAAARCLPMA